MSFCAFQWNFKPLHFEELENSHVLIHKEFNYNQCHKRFNLLCIQVNPEIILAFSPFSCSCCALWSLPRWRVLTSRYTHPLPHYGDIHRSDMEKQHKHTCLGAHTYKHAKSHDLPDCAGNQQTHSFCSSKIKRLCIAGREVVTAIRVLSPPQKNSGQDGGEQMSLHHQENKTVQWDTSTSSLKFRRDCSLFGWFSSVSVHTIISKESQPEKRAEWKALQVSKRAESSSPTAHPALIHFCRSNKATS